MSKRASQITGITNEMLVSCLPFETVAPQWTKWIESILNEIQHIKGLCIINCCPHVGCSTDDKLFQQPSANDCCSHGITLPPKHGIVDRSRGADAHSSSRKREVKRARPPQIDDSLVAVSTTTNEHHHLPVEFSVPEPNTSPKVKIHGLKENDKGERDYVDSSYRSRGVDRKGSPLNNTKNLCYCQSEILQKKWPTQVQLVAHNGFLFDFPLLWRHGARSNNKHESGITTAKDDETKAHFLNERLPEQTCNFSLIEALKNEIGVTHLIDSLEILKQYPIVSKVILDVNNVTSKKDDCGKSKEDDRGLSLSHAKKSNALVQLYQRAFGHPFVGAHNALSDVSALRELILANAIRLVLPLVNNHQLPTCYKTVDEFESIYQMRLKKWSSRSHSRSPSLSVYSTPASRPKKRGHLPISIARPISHKRQKIGRFLSESLLQKEEDVAHYFPTDHSKTRHIPLKPSSRLKDPSTSGVNVVSAEQGKPTPTTHFLPPSSRPIPIIPMMVHKL